MKIKPIYDKCSVLEQAGLRIEVHDDGVMKVIFESDELKKEIEITPDNKDALRVMLWNDYRSKGWKSKRKERSERNKKIWRDNQGRVHYMTPEQTQLLEHAKDEIEKNPPEYFYESIDLDKLFPPEQDEEIHKLLNY